MYENWMAHHGILGMKWGIRRYQNKDGSLTPQGKKHYNSGQTNGSPQNATPQHTGYNPTTPKKASGFETTKDRLQSKKSVRSLSDMDLQDRINRLKKERELKQLIDEQEAPVKSAIRKSMGKVGTRVLEDAATGAVKYAAGAAIAKSFNSKDLADMVVGKGGLFNSKNQGKD